MRLIPVQAGQAQHRRAPRAGPGRRRGASVVEFAIVAPVLFVLILGLVEFGRALMVSHLMTNAARQGCRAAIVQGQSTSQISTVVSNTLQSQSITGQTVTVKVNDVVADASTAQSGDEITVIVSVPGSSVSWLPKSLFFNGTLQGQYTLRRE